ncbi:MAG: DUF58 domain-containing protein [Bryobacteraceae bacterium]|nr:DUF58 domain-containing protein [Bryobacteraceae bacterium]MDW8378464.1 DUF58 domain-containing protein [Bryobacterales bacterium]
MGLSSFRLENVWRALLKWRRAQRHQITWNGAIFSLFIVLVGSGAFASGNNLLFLLLAAMLSTLLISGLVSRLGLAGLELRLLVPEHVFAKRKLPARLQLHNSKRWMPSFSIQLASLDAQESPGAIYFPMIPAGGTLDAPTSVFFPKRGLYTESLYQFTTRFPFGFTERRVQVKLEREVLVYPSIDPPASFHQRMRVLEGELETHVQGRGSDFYRIRPYEYGESARHVDWRATAHTGQLQVREFAREQDRLVEIFLDLRVPPGAGAWFEDAIECAACLCWRLNQRGSRLRFLTQTVDLRLPEGGDIFTILRYLAQVGPASLPPRLYPQEENSYRVVFSALFDSQLADLGWARAAIIDGRDRSAISSPDFKSQSSLF